MSQAGRYAHEQNTKRHAQRGFNQPVTRVAETIETATWMSSTMEMCRDLADINGNIWSIEEAVIYMSTVSPTEMERRLRYLSKLGFLKMTAEWQSNKFIGYRFGMVDVNLPK